MDTVKTSVVLGGGREHNEWTAYREFLVLENILNIKMMDTYCYTFVQTHKGTTLRVKL